MLTHLALPPGGTATTATVAIIVLLPRSATCKSNRMSQRFFSMDLTHGNWTGAEARKIWSRSTQGDGNDGGNGGEQWTCTHTLEGHTDYVMCVAVLPNGDVVSGSNDHTLKIWVPRYTL